MFPVQYRMKLNSLGRWDRSQCAILSASAGFATYNTRNTDQNFLDATFGSSDCRSVCRCLSWDITASSVASAPVKRAAYSVAALGGMGPICTTRLTRSGYFMAYNATIDPI